MLGADGGSQTRTVRLGRDIRTNLIEFGGFRYYLFPDYLDWGVEPAERPLLQDFQPAMRQPVYGIAAGEFDYVTICTTNKCNTICKYCFRGFDMSERPSLDGRIFRDVADHFHERSTAQRTIQFTGGEIFVVPDFVDWLEYARDKGFRLWLNSNGIDKRIASDRRLHDIIGAGANAHIRISLDGHTPELHERFRKRGSFRQVVRNIEALCRAGADVSVKSVLTPENFPYIEEMLEFVCSLGVSGWNYNVIRQTGAMAEIPPEAATIKCDEAIPYVTYLEINRTLVDIVRRKPRLGPLLTISRFGKDMDTLYSEVPHGLRMVPYFLNYDGNVYFTDDLLVPEYCRGNIFEDGMGAFNGFGELVDKMDTNLPACKRCPIHMFCFQKGNYGELYAIDQTLQSEFPNCDDIRAAFYFLLSQNGTGADLYESMFP